MSKLTTLLLVVGLALSVLVLLVAGLVPAGSSGLQAGTGEAGEQWCETMMELPNHQWQEEQTLAFANNCLTD